MHRCRHEANRDDHNHCRQWDLQNEDRGRVGHENHEGLHAINSEGGGGDSAASRRLTRSPQNRSGDKETATGHELQWECHRRSTPGGRGQEACREWETKGEPVLLAGVGDMSARSALQIIFSFKPRSDLLDHFATIGVVY